MTPEEASDRLVEIIRCYCEAHGVDVENSQELNAHTMGIWKAIAETGDFPLITFHMFQASVSQEMMRDHVRGIFTHGVKR